MPTTVKIRRSGTASATPSALEHGEIAINYADGKVFWKNASDVITSFTFQSYALASHTHSISDVTGLQTALDGKASSSHTHGNITNAGAIGSTADQFVVTTTSGVLTAVSAATARTTLSVQPTASPAFTGTASIDSATANTDSLVVRNSGATTVNHTGGMRFRLNTVDPAAIRIVVTSEATGASNLIFLTSSDPTTSALTTRLTISSTGTATFAGQILADDIDTANSVAYGFDSDPDTGIGRRGANILTAVTGGVERLRVSSSGNVTIGEANSANARLMVAGGSSNISSARATYEGTLQINESSLTTLEATGGIEFKTSVFGSGYGAKILGADDGSLIVGNRANSATWSESFRVNQNREMLIGTTTDNGAYLLQVNSQIYATNATIATSDARFKTRVESLTDATSVIESLRPVAFNFIPQEDRNFATERQVGLIAQEAQAALAGTDYADSVVAQCGDHLGLAYEKLVPVLIKALQESNARIAALEERLSHA